MTTPKTATTMTLTNSPTTRNRNVYSPLPSIEDSDNGVYSEITSPINGSMDASCDGFCSKLNDGSKDGSINDNIRETKTNYGSMPADGSFGSKTTVPLLKKPEDKIEILPFVLINISLALINCSSRFHGPVMDQYIYQESARQVLGNDSIITTSKPCLPANATSHLNTTLEALIRQAQDLASSTLFHLDMTSYGIGVLSNSVLGAYSGVMNRKLLLLIPTFGYFLRNVTIPVVIYWKLTVKWLFLGYGLDGLCGNASGIYFGSYLYTTDITSRTGKRTLGVAILHSFKGLVTAALNIATGHLIEVIGVFLPSVISAGCVLASMMTVCCLPNRKPRIAHNPERSRWSLTAAFKSYLIPFKGDNRSGRSKLLILGYTSFLLVLICHFGVTKIRNLYLMDLPYCWGSEKIGWFLFGREFGTRIVVLVMVSCCHRKLPGVSLAILGTLSYIGGQVVYTLAQTSFQVYFAPGAGFGQSLPLPLIRGEMSRLFEPEVQGPLFAGFAVLESISFALGSLFLQIYSWSLAFFPRLVFVISGGINVMVVIVLVAFQILWSRYLKKQRSQKLDKTITVDNNNHTAINN